jgi:hypothetical protein
LTSACANQRGVTAPARTREERRRSRADAAQRDDWMGGPCAAQHLHCGRCLLPQLQKLLVALLDLLVQRLSECSRAALYADACRAEPVSGQCRAGPVPGQCRAGPVPGLAEELHSSTCGHGSATKACSAALGAQSPFDPLMDLKPPKCTLGTTIVPYRHGQTATWCGFRFGCIG